MDGPSTFIIKYRSFSTTLDLLLWDCCYGILVEMTGGAMRMVCLEKNYGSADKKINDHAFFDGKIKKHAAPIYWQVKPNSRIER